MLHLINDLYYWWIKRRIFLFFIIYFLNNVNFSLSVFSGGTIEGYIRLTLVDSPYHIKENIVIEKNGELRIDPGVILYFLPRKGITVFGKLYAKGTYDDKILFTIDTNNNFVTNFHVGNLNNLHKFSSKSLISNLVNWPTVRLVDGLQPSEGRLQIYYYNKWHSVCTNSKNWTKIDTTIICRQLGFNSGYWYHWYQRNNDSLQFMLEHPACNGNEVKLEECFNWNKKAVGSGICDYHMDIGIKCDNEFYFSPNFWSGIRFLNAQSEIELVKKFDNKVSKQKSKSVLQNLVIEYAGEDNERKATPALLSIGVPPELNSISIKWSASTALSINDPQDSVSISNSYFIENRGYGIFVNTSWGSVELNNVKIDKNGADGVRYVLHQDFLVGHDFCQFTKLGQTQVYPVRLTYEQMERSLSRIKCCQVFELPKILEEARLTIHFTYLMNENIWVNEEEKKLSKNGYIEIFDGYKQEFIAKFDVTNNTYPASFTSSQNRMQVCYIPGVFKKSLFTLITLAGNGKAYDLNITKSIITNNNGLGVLVQNQRSGLVVNHSVIANNTYLSGIGSTNGVGDFIVNNTIIKDNIGDGINIFLADGYRHIDRSIIKGNTGHGVAFYFNEFISSPFFTESSKYNYQVTYSELSKNLGIALLIGNECKSDAFWNISMNKFISNFDDTIKFESCWNSKVERKQSVYITHNEFSKNRRLAINMAPLLNNKNVIIKHNEFSFHRKGVIYINNNDFILDDLSLEESEVNVRIVDNYFSNNKGYFVVNLGLTEDNINQKILFSKNILKDNSVHEPYNKLNPRSRVSAVITVSSSNTEITRNNLNNPDSLYEIGVHLEHHSKIINATYNYFGNLSKMKQTLKIYKRIFDRKNRYNLAFLDYIPYRTDEYDLDTNELISSVHEKDKRMNFVDGNKILGGEIRGHFTLHPGSYLVLNDIFIAPNSVLTIKENTILEFDYSIGMMVQGDLEIKTSINNPIIFTDIKEFVSEDYKNTYLIGSNNSILIEASDLYKKSLNFTFNSKLEDVNINNLDLTEKNKTDNDLNKLVSSSSTENLFLKQRSKKRSIDAKASNVRLSNLTEGRVEVQIGGEWGSVCSYNFDIIDATVVCQQLGLVLNSKNWLLEKNEFINGNNFNYVILSNVACTKFDYDILSCKSEKKNQHEFENSCFSEVGIKCNKPSWSGLRFGIASKSRTIENIIIENAGLLDYSTNMFKPALQIDFNKHKFRNLKIVNNLDSGLGIMWNNIFNKENLEISDSDISSNANHGITSASHGFEIRNCHIAFNKKSGFNYFPMFTNWEQRDLISWISQDENKNLINLLENLHNNSSIYIQPNHSWFINIQRPNKTSNLTEINFQIETNIGHSIGIFVLNSMNPFYTDNLILKYRDKQWDLRKNLTSFTMVHYVFKFNLIYIPGEKPLGKILLYLHSKPIIPIQFKSLLELEKEENYRLQIIKIEGNKFLHNTKAITSYHFNKNRNKLGDHFHRYDNETFLIHRNLFENNYGESIHVESLIHDTSFSKLSQINYTLIKNEFRNNQQVIAHTSNDLHANSNNLFHWKINSNLIARNLNGGLNIYLPYVRQYNQNNTHSVSLDSNIFINNQNFEFILNGHFSKFNLTSNTFRENNCQNGLILVCGMEKEMLIENNKIEDNFGDYMVEFNLQSHADKFGLIQASFQLNKILNNKNHFLIKSFQTMRPFNYAISIRGVQYINITRNLFNNPNLNYEFLAGVLTGSLKNKINVRYNWWGIYNETAIKDRIFDFDDWNSYALANFKPFLATESFESIIIKDSNERVYYDHYINLRKPIGGRLYKDLTLTKKNSPYIIKSDLTIMPQATLFIEAGVVLEFYPNIGILSLGNLYAIGTFEEPIMMRSIQNEDENRSNFHHSKREILNIKKETIFQNYSQVNNIRLCKSVYCEEYDSKKIINDGFVEIYNSTTLQWVPICDSTFTERNAEVVCNYLGYSTLNVHLNFGKRLNMDQALLSRIKFWPQSLQCNGKENKIDECKIRNTEFNNNFNSFENTCHQESENFVYIYCGREAKQNENDYWGGLRFTLSDFENHQTDNFYLSKRMQFTSESRLYNVKIINAGMLHGEKNSAIQIVQRDLNLAYITISGCAYHGIEVISPNGHLLFDHLNIYNNLGSALNYLLLDGAVNKNSILPYKPTKISTLSYNVFSLVDICDINKNLIVDQRILIYYKYSSKSVDCVKIFKSSRPSEKVVFRILQINLFNSTNISDQTDFLRIYDGDLFNYTSRLIGDLGVTEFHRQTNPQDLFYQSTFESMSIRLHASCGRYEFGLIGEIVTSTSHFYGGALYNNITFSNLENNFQGALTYRSVGETTPVFSLIHNTIKSNCFKLFANFTSCNSALDIEVQNSPFVLIDSNLIEKNIGGLSLSVNAHYLGAALKGSLISNNLFRNNFFNEVLVVKALTNNDFFKFVKIYRNYFTNNISPFHDNIIISQMLCNFTQNIVVKNQGLHQLNVLGFDLNSHLYQEIHGNWFYNNLATKLGERSTILANSAGQHYLKNYFVNLDNDFEISTVNKSKLKKENYFVDARNNWWGFNSLPLISGRVRDYLNNPDYIRIKYDDFLTHNSSLLSSICTGGWKKIGDTCFLYVSARMSFEQANNFCEQENSTMPFVITNYEEITQYISEINTNFNKHYDSIWVQSFQYSNKECTVLLNENILVQNCLEKLPFLCEKDPFVRLAANYDNWFKDTILMSVLLMSTLIAFLFFICIGCWLCKSRERYREKLERRNSIRASIRSNRSYTLSSNALTEAAYKKQIEKALQMARENQQQQIHYGHHNFTNNNYSLSTLNENNFNTTDDQLIQMPIYNNAILINQQNHISRTFRLNPNNQVGSYESFHENNLHHNNQAFVNESSFEEETSTHNYNTLRPINQVEDRFANDACLENANIELLIKPTFDLTYENAGFKETPTISRNSEYADAREWTPVNENSFQLDDQISNSILQFKKNKLNKKPPSITNNNNNNNNKKSLHKPLPPVAKYRNQHASSSNMKQMHQRNASLSMDFNPEAIDPYNSQPNLNNHLYTFQSRSQSTLLESVSSDITATTAVSQNRKYLETSLDNDSIADNAIDYYENSNRYSPSISVATASTSRSRPPMETAM